MRKTLLIIICSIPLIGMAQPEKLDSLLRIWKDSTNNSLLTRIEAIDFVAWNGYVGYKNDSAIYYGKWIYDNATILNNNKYMASGLNTQADAYLYLGQYQKAIDLFTASGKLRLLENDSTGYANTCFNIGNCYKKNGNNFNAIKQYKECLNIYKKYNKKNGLANTYNAIGLIHFDQNENENAIEFYFKTLDIYNEMGDNIQVGNTYSNIAFAYIGLDDYSKAFEYLNKALKIRESLNSIQGMAHSNLSLATAYSSLNNTEKATEHYEKSLELYKSIKSEVGVAVININLGRLNQDNKNYIKALECFNYSYNFYTKINNTAGKLAMYNFIGNLYLEMKDFTKAEEFFKERMDLALEINKEEEIANTYHNFSKLLLQQKKYKESLELIKKAQKEYNIEKYNSKSTIATTLYEIYIALDSFELAKKQLNKIIDYHLLSLKRNFPILSESEKEKYFEKMITNFELVYEFTALHSENFPEMLDQSYNLALLTKGILLKSSTAMKKSILQSKDTILINKYQEWLELKEKIAKQLSQGKDTNLEEDMANKKEKELISLSNEFSKFNKTLNPSWIDVKSTLKKNEVAIEFIKFKETKNDDSTSQIYYGALLVTNKSHHPKLIKLCTENDLLEILKKLQTNNIQLINNLYNGENNNESLLFKLIWEPLENDLNSKKIIYYSPIGLLNKISLGAIKGNKNIHLCNKYILNLKGNTNQFNQDEIKLKDQSFALFGDINYNTDSTTTKVWQHLDGSKVEIEKIQKIFSDKNNSISIYNSNDATESKFKLVASQKNVIHVASHGFYYDFNTTDSINITYKQINFRGNNSIGNLNFVQNPNSLMRTGLIFSGANDVWNPNYSLDKNPEKKDDGVLTAHEISNLNMQNVELIVLSACETGLGEIKGSEGVYGFQRTLKIAGVKNILMALWQVPDNETVEFMTYFYTNFSLGFSIDESFSKAQKTMSLKYPPYFWGAFVLMH